MVNINAEYNGKVSPNNPSLIGFKWDEIALADVPQAKEIFGGSYQCEAGGTWGGASIEIHESISGNSYKAIDSTNLNFSADGSYNFTVGAGTLIKPILTGGDGTTDLSVNLAPIPNR